MGQESIQLCFFREIIKKNSKNDKCNTLIPLVAEISNGEENFSRH